MVYDSLTVQEIGSSKLLIYKDDFNHLNFTLKLPNILTFVRTNFLNTPLCYFDVTDKIALVDLQRFAISRFNILKILKTTTDVIDSCTKQGIAVEHILFDPSYVFVDSNYEPYFVPLSISGNTLKEVKYFLKSIITDSIIEPATEDAFVQILLNCFNDSQFTFDKLSALVNKLVTNPVAQTIPPVMQMPQIPPEKKTSSMDEALLTEFFKNHLESLHQKSLSSPAEEKEPQFSAPASADFSQREQESEVQIPASDPALEHPSSSTYHSSEEEIPSVSNTVNPGFVPNFRSTEEALADQRKSTPYYTPNSASLTEDSSDPPHFFPNPEEEQSLEIPATPTENTIQNTPPEKAYLIYAEKPDTYIELNELPFLIGRHPDMVDYIINSPYIGRTHAQIGYKDGSFYVEDDSSTNGTFVNGERIPTRTLKKIVDGDMLQFAKYPFKFIIK